VQQLKVIFSLLKLIKDLTMKKSLLAAALITPFLTGCVIAVSDGEAETHWAGNDSSSWQHQHKKNPRSDCRFNNG
jgi:hypothetical protein